MPGGAFFDIDGGPTDRIFGSVLSARHDSGDESARAHLNNARQSLMTVRALTLEGIPFSADEVQSLVLDVLRRLTAAERELTAAATSGHRDTPL